MKKKVRAHQLMTESPVTCHSNDNLARAAQLLWEYDIGALPVIDDDGGLVGMLTDRDICMAAYTRGTSLRDIPVSLAMATSVQSCGPNDSIDAIEEKMCAAHVRRIPVVDDADIPIGLVSTSDLLRHAAESRDEAIDRAFVQTLAEACKPRRSSQIARINRSVVKP